MSPRAPRGRPAALAALAAVALVLLLLAPLLPASPPLAGAALAQEATRAAEVAAPDYDAWEQVARRAEQALESGRASDAALEELRAELASWRRRFLDAQSINAPRIETLRAQIEALGPPPGEGEPPEAPEIAARRAELTAELATAEAPRLRAVEAFNRADALVNAIDRLLRERQADALLELGPSPLNPALWPAAAAELVASLGDVSFEVTRNIGNDVRRAQLRDNLPLTLGLLLLGLALILRGRLWTERLSQGLHDRLGPSARDIASFAVSLGQVAAPVLGLWLLQRAALSSALPGRTGLVLLETLPLLGVAFFGARWIGSRLFPDDPRLPTPLPVPPEARGRARVLVATLGLVVWVNAVLGRLAEAEGYAPEVVAVLAFPPVLAAGLALFRLALMVLAGVRASGEEDAAATVRDQVLSGLARISLALALAAPLLAAVGYRQAGETIAYATVESLALLALLAILRYALQDLYAFLTGSDPEQASQALLPVLGTFVLALASLPVLALIWGARPAELAEVWAWLRQGFQIGDTRISPTDFLVFVTVFAIGYSLTRVLQGILRSTVLPRTRLDAGSRTAIVSGLGYVGIFVSALVAIGFTGLDLSSLAIVAGALSVGIGFGLQNIVSNFVSGIILLIERPISEGDWIEVGGHMGIVKSISVRSTRIETFDRTDVIVPNADFVSGAVINWTHGNTLGRAIVPVGVAYGTDTEKVDAILREIASAHPVVAAFPKPVVHFRRFGADALEFEVFCILRDVNQKLQVTTDLNHAIARRFAEEGIEIPFAQRDLWIRTPEAREALSAVARRMGDQSGPRPEGETDGAETD